MGKPPEQVVRAPELRLTWITGALTAVVPGVVGALKALGLGKGGTVTMVAGIALVALVVIALVVIYAVDVRARTAVTVAEIQARSANPNAEKLTRLRTLAQEENGLLEQIS
ncbi:MAG: hypothetical protein ACRDJO_01190 [Actinomycetota bacterium]